MTSDYTDYVPENTFISRYLRFMRRQETAFAYDFWSALWAVGAVCGRATHVARPRAPVYLNMFLILVGESGVARKTTSVSMAGGLVRAILSADDEIGYLDAKMTAEKLDDLLHERTQIHGTAQLCINIPELAVFLGVERYLTNMPMLLTDLYDCPTHRHGGGTIIRGESIQRNVWLSFLSASTQMWLMKSVNPDVIEGGFSSRCLFIVSNEPKRKIAWPDATSTDADRAVMLGDLRTIRDHALQRQPITLSAHAMSAFSTWYGKRERSYDLFRQSFEAREDSHVLRIAALLCINDGAWCVDEQHVLCAIKLVDEVKRSSGDIFQNMELHSKFTRSLDLLRSSLISAGMDPIPRHELSRRCRQKLTLGEFNGLLEVLHEIGAVQRFSSHPEGRGRPTEFYRGTEELLERRLTEQVLAKVG